MCKSLKPGPNLTNSWVIIFLLSLNEFGQDVRLIEEFSVLFKYVHDVVMIHLPVTHKRKNLIILWKEPMVSGPRGRDPRAKYREAPHREKGEAFIQWTQTWMQCDSGKFLTISVIIRASSPESTQRVSAFKVNWATGTPQPHVVISSFGILVQNSSHHIHETLHKLSFLDEYWR